MARQSHAGARQLLATEARKDYDAYMDEYEKFEDENIAAMERSGWGSLLGSIGLPLAAAFLSPVGIPMIAGSLLSGAGSYLGAQTGEHWKGSEGVRGREAITKRRLRSDVGRQLKESAKQYEGFGQEQAAGAISSGIQAYFMGGGDLPGSDAWSKGGGVKGLFGTGKGTMGPWAGIKGPETFANIGTSIKDLLQPGQIEGFDYSSLQGSGLTQRAYDQKVADIAGTKSYYDYLDDPWEEIIPIPGPGFGNRPITNPYI
jgi:hypothetical protein